MAGLDAQLRGDVALLGELRLFERHVGALEIGAGILHVFVEEEPIELARQVVVMLDVALGARRRVDLVQPAERVAQPLDGLQPGGLDGGARSEVLVDQLEQSEHVALEEIDIAVHVGFGQCQHRIEGDRPLGAARLDQHMHRVAGAVAEFVGRAVRPGDFRDCRSGRSSGSRAAAGYSWHTRRSVTRSRLFCSNLMAVEKFRVAQKSPGVAARALVQHC